MERYYVRERIAPWQSTVYDVIDYVTSKPCHGLDGLARRDIADRHARVLNEGYRTIRALTESILAK